MQNNKLEIPFVKEQPLDRWVDDTVEPILASIYEIVIQLELLFAEVR